MNEDSAGVRPETLALDILIKQTIEQGNFRSSSRLISDNQHTLFPVMVIQDPVLEPVDKLVWMAICLQLHESGGNAIFPTYDKIAKTANVSSSATVSRALTILRLTRWLTLCAKASDVGRGVHGNAYVLHDESLPLMDTIYLDSSYQSFLRESTEHYHARVKTVARGLLEDVDEGIEVNGNASAEEQPIVSSTQGSERVEKKVLRRYFSYSGKVMNGLRSHSPDKNCLVHTVQNLKEVENRVQNLKATRSNAKNVHPQNIKTVRKMRSLIYPRRLSEKQREVADHHLSRVPVEKRQNLLDEMEGRIRAEKLGMPPLYDDLSFLNTLCKALKNGTFKFNLGIKVEESRQVKKRAELEKLVDITDQSDSEKLKELRREIVAGRGPLANIRKILGMHKSSVR